MVQMEKKHVTEGKETWHSGKRNLALLNYRYMEIRGEELRTEKNGEQEPGASRIGTQYTGKRNTVQRE